MKVAFSVALLFCALIAHLGVACENDYCKFTYLGCKGFNGQGNPFYGKLAAATNEYAKSQTMWFSCLYNLEHSFLMADSNAFSQAKASVLDHAKKLTDAFDGAIHTGYVSLLEISILRMLQHEGDGGYELDCNSIKELLPYWLFAAMKKGEARWGGDRNILRTSVFRELILLAHELIAYAREHGEMPKVLALSSVDAVSFGNWHVRCAYKNDNAWCLNATRTTGSTTCRFEQVPEICELGGGVKSDEIVLTSAFTRMRKEAFTDRKVLLPGTPFACRIDHDKKVFYRGHPFVWQCPARGVLIRTNMISDAQESD